MKRILLTALLIVTANTASALQLSIKHNKDLPTPWQLMSKGKIIDQRKSEKSNSFIYYIAWDKTDDFYVCGLPPCNFCIEINLIELELSKFNINPFKNSNV